MSWFRRTPQPPQQVTFIISNGERLTYCGQFFDDDDHVGVDWYGGCVRLARPFVVGWEFCDALPIERALPTTAPPPFFRIHEGRGSV